MKEHMTAIHRIEIPIPYAVKWVNCYYIEDSVPTLIDTGMNNAESFDALASGIRNAGGDISHLRRIIATHGHSDHAGLARRISDMSGAEIFVHSWDRTKLSNGVHLKTRIQAFRGFLFDAGVPDAAIADVVSTLSDMFSTLMGPVSEATMLDGGEVFDFDDFQLRVIHAPGHSPGSVCLFDEANGDLFSGDCILGEIIADPTSNMKSLVEHQASLDSIADLPVQKVLPGHGAAFSSHRRRIGRIRAYHDRRSQKVLSIFKRSGDPNRTTPFSIASELFPSMKGMDVLYCVSTVRAHLELLGSRGEIDCVTSGRNGH